MVDHQQKNGHWNRSDFENETSKKFNTVSALSYTSKHCQGVTDWTGSFNDLVYKKPCHFRKYSVYALNISSHLEREWGWDAKERGGTRLEQDP